MGEPICRNLARKSGLRVVALDRDPRRCSGSARTVCASAASIGAASSSRRGRRVSVAALGRERATSWRTQPKGFSPWSRAGQIVVDLEHVAGAILTRALAPSSRSAGALHRCAGRAHPCGGGGGHAGGHGGRGCRRLRAGAAAHRHVRQRHHAMRPGRLRAGGEDPEQHGAVRDVVAISEAKAIGERAGVDRQRCCSMRSSKGSADSFALRNHGMKAVLPGEFPERAFPGNLCA